MNNRELNEQKLREGCTLEQLVNLVVVPKSRDPLLVKRELPLFALNSGIPTVKRPITESQDLRSPRSPQAPVSCTYTGDGERFLAYERAARRNYILDKDIDRYELSHSPLNESLYTCSTYPDTELTPELKQRQGAVQAFKSLHRLKVRNSQCVKPVKASSSTSFRKQRKTFELIPKVDHIHKVLEQAYSSSLPKPPKLVSSHTGFLKKSPIRTLSQERSTLLSKEKLQRKDRDSMEKQLLFGEQILTVVNSYRAELAAKIRNESVYEEKEKRKDPVHTPSSSQVSGLHTQSSTIVSKLRKFELSVGSPLETCAFGFPKRTFDPPSQARFKLPQSDVGELRIEVPSRFMQISPLIFRPKNQSIR